MTASSLLARTARGAAWVVSWRAATRLLGLGSTLVLVRLLRPADFGLVALATGFASAIDAFSVIGVEEALIRAETSDRAMLDTGFTLNVLRGLITAALVAALAFPAAAFFAEPVLAPMLLALAAGAAAEGAENIGVVQFRRDMAFEREFFYLILPRILGILAAIGTAWATRGPWALVAGILTTRLLRVALSYRVHPYRPRVSLAAWRPLVPYSLWSWGVGLAMLLRDRADSVLIGRLLGPEAVGLYAVGAEIAALPTTELVEPLARAAFSGFAAERRAGVSPGPGYLRLIASMALLTVPAGVGLALVAGPLVAVAFGPGWAAAVPVVRILGVAGTAMVFGGLAAHLLSAHGILVPLLRAVLAGLALRVALLAALLMPFGLPGGAASAGLAIAMEQGATMWLACRRFGVRLRDVLAAIWRCLAATAAMAAVLGISGLGWEGGMLSLLAGAGVGAAVYAAALAALWLLAGRPAGAEADLWAMLLATLLATLRRIRASTGRAKPR